MQTAKTTPGIDARGGESKRLATLGQFGLEGKEKGVLLDRR